MRDMIRGSEHPTCSPRNDVGKEVTRCRLSRFRGYWLKHGLILEP